MRSHIRHFRSLVFSAAIVVSPLALPQSTQEFTFFSWYDGWGTHQVWGVGRISASHTEALVKCGQLRIKVIPIYDTHSAGRPPNKEESADFAKSHNLSVV